MFSKSKRLETRSEGEVLVIEALAVYGLKYPCLGEMRLVVGEDPAL